MPRSSILWLIISLAPLGTLGCSSSAGDPASNGPAPIETAVAARDDCETVFGTDRLSGAANSFGECSGICVSELRFDANNGCRSLNLSFRRWADLGQAVPALIPPNHGALSDRGLEMGQAVAASLRGKSLSQIYGCPDCADGGRTVLYKQRGTVESALAYEFEHPPVELQTADSFLQPLIDALATCSTSDLITIDAASCTPKPQN